VSGGVDFEDPCARAKALWNAHTRRLMGEQEIKVRFRSGDDEQEVQFAQASLEEIARAAREADAECAAVNPGHKPRVRRFAISFGARR
jgi:F420-dependent methylenetetrahydromethanopterin dehydrogenase